MTSNAFFLPPGVFFNKDADEGAVCGTPLTLGASSVAASSAHSSNARDSLFGSASSSMRE
jgi:hypothetical protein